MAGDFVGPRLHLFCWLRRVPLRGRRRSRGPLQLGAHSEDKGDLSTQAVLHLLIRLLEGSLRRRLLHCVQFSPLSLGVFLGLHDAANSCRAHLLDRVDIDHCAKGLGIDTSRIDTNTLAPLPRGQSAGVCVCIGSTCIDISALIRRPPYRATNLPASFLGISSRYLDRNAVDFFSPPSLNLCRLLPESICIPS